MCFREEACRGLTIGSGYPSPCSRAASVVARAGTRGRGLSRANRRESRAQLGERDPTERCAYGLDIIPFLA